MSVGLVPRVEFTPHGTCNICLDELISKRWRGKNNVIAVLHSSSSPSCFFHEKCIRAWAGRHGEKSNKCTDCLRQISDVAFYKCGRSGAFKPVIRHPLQVYEHPIEAPPPAGRIDCGRLVDVALGIFCGFILLDRLINYNLTSSLND